MRDPDRFHLDQDEGDRPHMSHGAAVSIAVIMIVAFLLSILFAVVQ